MDPGKRNELIDEYYEAVDAERFAEFERVFASDVEYLYPDEPPLYGVDQVQRYFEGERAHSNSTHVVTHRVADGDVTICEGSVTADAPDGSEVDVRFVGVFEFDDEAGAIDRVRVYTG